MKTYLLISALSIAIIYIVCKLSQKMKLLDYPNNSRKLHLEPTPYTGGIAILIINILVIKIMGNYDIQIKNLLIFSSLIVLLGFIDDKYTLRVPTRVILQITFIFLIIQQGFMITNLGEIFADKELYLGPFSILFTIISVAIITNGINYIDGIDGLASSLFLNSIYIMIIYILLDHGYQKNVIELLISISIPALIFFLFNNNLFKLPKLFLGDNGSLLLGFTLSFLLIYLAQNKNLIESGQVIWIVSLIFFDFFSTNISRIIKNKSFFNAGVDHLHFFLKQKIGLTKTLFLMNLINIFLGFYGYAIWYFFGNLISIINFIIFSIIYLFLLNKINFNKITQNI